jgi:hypothetical protein
MNTDMAISPEGTMGERPTKLGYAVPQTRPFLSRIRWVAGLPGAFGFAVLLPALMYGAGGVIGPAAVFALLVLQLIMAIVSVHIAWNYCRRVHEWVGLLVDGAWIVVQLSPWGLGVLVILLLDALKIPYWVPQ